MRLSIVAVATALSASLCQAQASPSVDGRGKHFIAVDVGSNTLIGVGLRAGTRTDVMLEAGVRFFENGSAESRVVSVRPALKRYFGSTERSVAPYLLLGLRAEWNRLDFGGPSQTNNRELGGIAAVGVDWFPTQRVSVGGHIGMEALALRSERPDLLLGTNVVTEGHEIGTFSSGIRLRLFF